MEDLSDCPQHAEHEQDAHKRGQMGDGLEDGHEAETAHAEPEDRVALGLGELAHLRLRQILLLVELTFQLILQDEGRYEHRHQRRYEDLRQHTLCRYDALDPKHNRRDVANRREGASGVGCNHHQCRIDQTVAAALNEFAQHHNHHDGGGKVVEDGREEEGHKGHAPHQFALRARLHRIAYEVETAVGVHNLNDRHGTHQEEERASGIAEVMLDDLSDVVDHIVGGNGWVISRGARHQQGPAAHTHQQGNGCLVHFCQAFEGYTEVADAEEDDNTNS